MTASYVDVLAENDPDRVSELAAFVTDDAIRLD